MENASKVESIKKEIAEFINQIPWIQNLEAEFYFTPGLTHSKGLKYSGQQENAGFNMTEGMVDWIWGYADGILDWETRKKVKRARPTSRKVSKV